MAENKKFTFISECCGEKYDQAKDENEFGQRYTCRKCGEVCNIKKIKMGKTYKGFRFKIDNKMRGCIGETDYEKKIVRINKKRAKKRKELGKTIYHETDHINHEQKHEKTVYKDEKRFPKISGKQKQRLYNLL